MCIVVQFSTWSSRSNTIVLAVGICFCCIVGINIVVAATSIFCSPVAKRSSGTSTTTCCWRRKSQLHQNIVVKFAKSVMLRGVLATAMACCLSCRVFDAASIIDCSDCKSLLSALPSSRWSTLSSLMYAARSGLSLLAFVIKNLSSSMSTFFPATLVVCIATIWSLMYLRSRLLMIIFDWAIAAIWSCWLIVKLLAFVGKWFARLGLAPWPTVGCVVLSVVLPAPCFTSIFFLLASRQFVVSTCAILIAFWLYHDQMRLVVPHVWVQNRTMQSKDQKTRKHIIVVHQQTSMIVSNTDLFPSTIAGRVSTSIGWFLIADVSICIAGRGCCIADALVVVVPIVCRRQCWQQRHIHFLSYVQNEVLNAHSWRKKASRCEALVWTVVTKKDS